MYVRCVLVVVSFCIFCKLLIDLCMFSGFRMLLLVFCLFCQMFKGCWRICVSVLYDACWLLLDVCKLLSDFFVCFFLWDVFSCSMVLCVLVDLCILFVCKICSIVCWMFVGVCVLVVCGCCIFVFVCKICLGVCLLFGSLCRICTGIWFVVCRFLLDC